ncbi:MAG: cysteine--tRNA ligase [Patescibacteria group bacterium]
MLNVYNTLSRKKEEFKPLKGKTVSFYQCGPTVYWTQHIGNLRAMVLADLIVRSLDYLGYKVKFVRNYTDVGHLTSDRDEGEDKLEKAARQEKLSPKEIADKYIKIFESDTRDLNIIEPWRKPRATAYIKEMAKLVQALIDGGYAYATDLAIYFEVKKFKNYNKLSGQNLEKNITDAGKGEVSDPNKKSPLDFALWFFKAGVHQNALQTWKVKFKNINQPVLEGFPGWHLECSAMSRKLLGDTLDIHMGGVEHIPVHHTNEIAQSEAASGKKFVDYWLHNEHLTVDGGKMAKSEGTSYSLADIKKKGYDPMVLRYFFLQAHYRSKQNFTWSALEGAKTALDSIKDKIVETHCYASKMSTETHVNASLQRRINEEYRKKFLSAISDDFNIPQALAVVFEVIKADLPSGDKSATILDFDKVLGLGLDKIKPIKIPKEVEKLARERQKARVDKDFKKSDRLRDEIDKLGYVVEDEKDGYKLKKK